MSDDPKVEGMEWPRFAEWFRKKWEPGQHLAVVGPTGVGKTTFVRALLGGTADNEPLRRWVLALDPKGGDSTLASLGWERMSTWPPPKKFWREIEQQKRTSARLIIGNKVDRKEDFGRLAATFRACLDDAFATGGWTIYVDELQLAADRRMMGLGSHIEMHLIAARDKGTSIVTSYQRPANVPRTASDQSSWFATYYTRDVDVVGRLAEMAGRPRAEMRGLVRRLGDLEHAVMLFSNKPREPIVVTKPPKAARRRATDEQRSP